MPALKNEPSPNGFSAYADRNALLLQLGYASYEAYLRSEFWRIIRESVLKKFKHRCFACAGTARHVHHVRYDLETLQGKNTDNLVALCAGCHQNVEFDKYGNKRPFDEVNALLEKICRARIAKLPKPKKRSGAYRKGFQKTHIAPVGWRRSSR